ncbi:MAG: wax ester/triacylglycerol synthase family O-acyltransferase [Steroidobacteraceae bacterium]|jgi:WS/DGAT/MGAT family acyltransferase|nr:wax ester/triacylglycerol synthase family O-acyltransferase [Steroidobacteraceae bacterium]
MSRGIPPLDLMFLLAERVTQPSHVGALMILASPRGAPRDYVARLVARYRAIEPKPPFNLVPVIPVVGRPTWREAAEPDMRYHVRHLALPVPGREAQLWELVEELHAVPLDREQPLFRIQFIEGLAGGRFALYSQIHHAIIDGVSGLARTAAAFNDAPSARDLRAIYGLDSPPGKRRASTVKRHPLLRAVSGGRQQARALGDLTAFALHRLGGLLRPAAEEDAPQGSRLFSSARLPTNRPFSARRSFASFTVTAADVERIRKALGGTMNDVAMAIVDAGLSRYLAARGSPPSQPIVCMCPVNLRDKGDAEATIKVSAVFVAMGRPGESAARRLARISNNSAAAKAEMRGLSPDAALDLAVALYAAQEGAIALGVNALPPTANLVLSNTRFSDRPAWLGDARLKAFYPVSMIGGGIGLNVTFVSYDGRLDFGLVANQAAIPDTEKLARDCQRAFADLLRASSRPVTRLRRTR